MDLAVHGRIYIYIYIYVCLRRTQVLYTGVMKTLRQTFSLSVGLDVMLIFFAMLLWSYPYFLYQQNLNFYLLSLSAPFSHIKLHTIFTTHNQKTFCNPTHPLSLY